MKIAARTSSNSTPPRREQLMNEHQRAASLRELFPEIEQLRIELVFNDPNGRSAPPSPQLHTLFSAASAFFRFACPCADCDGDFDLTEAVTGLIRSSAGRKRVTSRGGHLSCHGVRFRDLPVHQSSCSMQVNFELQAEPHRTA